VKQHLKGVFFKNRHLSCTALASLLASASFAQQAQHQRQPDCKQSMITGAPWQVVLNQNYYNQSRNQHRDESGGFSCTINIAADGTITPANCTGGVTFIDLPFGHLTIDRTCHVAGSIQYNTCSYTACGVNIQLSISAWRSTDGSRLTGFQQWQCFQTNLTCLSSFELISGQ
jgi:hypothetical protein